METDKKLVLQIRTAFSDAWTESQIEPKIRDLQKRHSRYSTLFLEHFGELLENLYNHPRYIVHRRPRPEEMAGPQRPTEVQHDFDVFCVDESGLLRRNIWQIESEWAYTGSEPTKPRRRKAKLIEDVNKLICGCARNSLLITSLEWLHDDGDWFMDRLRRAATQWHHHNNTHGHFYIALMPFVSRWDTLKPEDLVCKVLKFKADETKFVKIISSAIHRR